MVILLLTKNETQDCNLRRRRLRQGKQSRSDHITSLHRRRYHHKSTQHGWNILRDSESRVRWDDDDDMWSQLYKNQFCTGSFLSPRKDNNSLLINQWYCGWLSVTQIILSLTLNNSWPTANAVRTSLMTYNCESITLITKLLLNL